MLRVLSLCDGMACGYLALLELCLPHQEITYHSVEIDPHARKLADHNLPNIVRWANDVKAITEEDIEFYGPFDLVIFGSPCFVAGSKVLTSTGYKNIEEIQVGEEVLTHTGRFKKVLKVGGKLAPIRKVKFQGTKEIITTDEHPFLVKEMTRKSINRKPTRVFSEEKWVPAKDLVKGCFGKQAFITPVSRLSPVTLEVAWIIGRFIADGHIRNSKRTEKGRENDIQYQLVLSIGSHKLEDVKSKVKDNRYSAYPHSKSVHRVVFSSKYLVQMLLDMGFENGAGNKKIPIEVFHWEPQLQKELLEGYMSGDGHYSHSTEEYACTSVSEDLILALQLLITTVYGTRASYNFCKRPDTTIIEGRVVNQKDTHTLRFKKYKPKQAKYHKDVKGIFMPLTYNTPLEVCEAVFNLEVEEDNTYTVNNIVVHNCQSVSVSGNGTGLDGASGLLLDCLKVKNWCERQNPNLNFLIENVKMKKDFLQQFIDLIGSKPVLINSALVSAQNRERYYWTGVDGIVPPERELICNTSIIEFDVDGSELELTETMLDKIEQSKHIGEETASANLVAFSSSARPENKREYRIRNTGPGNTLTTGPGCGGRMSINLVATEVGGAKQYRMLTVRECARLQTIPEWYDFSAVSNTQAYKVLGNGWTVKVIEHIFKQLPRVQDVLSK